MKLNPYTEKLWVLQNEDGSPNLVVFDPETRAQKLYTFAQRCACRETVDDRVVGRLDLEFGQPTPVVLISSGQALTPCR